MSTENSSASIGHHLVGAAPTKQLVPPYVVAVPLFRALPHLRRLLDGVERQFPRPVKLLLLESSTDIRDRVAASDVQLSGVSVEVIEVSEFDHGRTRNEALREAQRYADYCIFLTQDVELATTTSAAELIAALYTPGVWAVTGRQVARQGADPLEAAQRSRRYPNVIPENTVMLSNAFSAYATREFLSIGGFRERILWGEDYAATFDIEAAGGAVRYCPSAVVRHSHKFGYRSDFRRYFDAGAAAKIAEAERRPAVTSGSEGLGALVSDLRELLPRRPLWGLRVVERLAVRSAAYLLGRVALRLPQSWRPRLSSNPAFWSQDLEL